MHSEHLNAMVLHRGQLLTASADRTVHVMDTGLALRERADAELMRNGGRGFQPQGGTSLVGHRADVLHLHACGEHVASCAADGEVLVWDLGAGGTIARRWAGWRAYCVQLDGAGTLLYGGEGTQPLVMRSWRDGDVVQTLEDDEPPLHVQHLILAGARGRGWRRRW